MVAISDRLVKLFSVDLFWSKAVDWICFAKWSRYNKIEKHTADEDVKYGQHYDQIGHGHNFSSGLKDWDNCLPRQINLVLTVALPLICLSWPQLQIHLIFLRIVPCNCRIFQFGFLLKDLEHRVLFEKFFLSQCWGTFHQIISFVFIDAIQGLLTLVHSFGLLKRKLTFPIAEIFIFGLISILPHFQI